MSSHVKVYGPNLKGRDFFCTDLHGCYDLLHEKLKEVRFNSNVDRLFSGGDWCDRGPDSKYVLDYLNEPWINSVRANHEEMLISAYEEPNSRQAYQMLFCNGGEWYYDNYHTTPEDQKSIYETFKSLPLGIEIHTKSGKKVGIVHADIPYGDWEKFKDASGSELEMNVAAIAQWGRSRYDRKDITPIKNIDYVLVGHTPTHSGEIEILGNVHFCDLGSFFRGKISFMEIL